MGAPCLYFLTTAHIKSGSSHRPERRLTHQSDKQLHHSHTDVGVLCKNDVSYMISVLDHAIKLDLDTNHYLVDSNLKLQYSNK